MCYLDLADPPGFACLRFTHPLPPLERGRDTLQPDLDRCTTLADEIDAGRKGDRRLAAQER